jgi:hypothetical protein
MISPLQTIYTEIIYQPGIPEQESVAGNAGDSYRANARSICERPPTLWERLSRWWHGGYDDNPGTVLDHVRCAMSCQNFDDYLYSYAIDYCACLGDMRPTYMMRGR